MRPDTFVHRPRLHSARTAGPARRLIKLVGVLAVLSLLGAGFLQLKGRGFIGSGWAYDLAGGLNTARDSGKPAFVLFTADWCPPCRVLKRGVLADPRIMSSLKERFVLVKVDLTDRYGPNAGLAGQYEVGSIPTAIVFDTRGREVTRISGGQSLESWIRRKAASRG